MYVLAHTSKCYILYIVLRKSTPKTISQTIMKKRTITLTYWLYGEAETIKFFTQSQALNFILTNKIKNFYFS